METGGAAQTEHESSAVQPDHDRALCLSIRCRCENIEAATVFARLRLIADLSVCRSDRARRLRCLERQGDALGHSCPGLYPLGCPEPIFPASIGTIGNSEEFMADSRGQTADTARGNIDDGFGGVEMGVHPQFPLR